ncbi:MAG: FAD-dependent oxidoreductase [Deltaproteobacteria bacterium]|nr:FAD-dependent oxidoreductase [Deltaproteobacteria bacterium]
MTAKKRSEKAIKYEFKSYRDITPMHVSLGNMLYNKTGSWRFIKPIYEDKIPACQNACPAGNDIEGWVKLLQNKEFEKAYWHLKREEPFPAILGRVCFKFCEDACNRKPLDDCIRIQELERFLGDRFSPATPHPDLPADNPIHRSTDSPIHPDLPCDNTGQPLNKGRLAIVGSGPSAMSAAYFARLLGFGVTIFDKEALLGGMLRLGIPGYRLPRQVVAAEFEGLSRMGVELRPNTEIGKDIPLETLARTFDYVFLATGAHRSIPMELTENISCCQIMSALTLLKQVARGENIALGKRVVVIGGGNTAIDAARTAVRLGCQATVIYRRSLTEMPAHPDEVREAQEEGVSFRFLAVPEDIMLHADTTIEKLVCCEMELGPADESGRCRPVRKEGVTFDIPADTILMAIGEKPDFDYLGRHIPATDTLICTREDLSVPTDHLQGAKVFAGGDMIDIPHTVVHAVASGKRAAIAMDCDRRGLPFSDVLNRIRVGTGTAVSFSKYMNWAPVNPVQRNDRKVVDSSKIVYDYFIKTPGCEKTIQPADLRKESFEPYHVTLSEAEAIHETARCLHCGRCTECDNCLIFCPDVSILDQTRETFGYAIDYDYCKGCGICFTECPRHAMTMVAEG